MDGEDGAHNDLYGLPIKEYPGLIKAHIDNYGAVVFMEINKSSVVI